MLGLYKSCSLLILGGYCSAYHQSSSITLFFKMHMKNINSNMIYRIFSYACILGIMLILRIHEKNNVWLLLGLSFLLFSNIEASIFDIKQRFSLIAALKNPFQGGFLSNNFRFLSLSFFITSLVKMYFQS